jgi:hypothetical protein
MVVNLDLRPDTMTSVARMLVIPSTLVVLVASVHVFGLW